MSDTLYVTSGSLRDVAVTARDPEYAVCCAVRANLPCVLGRDIRVSVQSGGGHLMDVYFDPPYEDTFPGLFDGSVDVDVVAVAPIN